MHPDLRGLKDLGGLFRGTPMETLTFEQKLQRYADLTVKVGLNLQSGQRLVIIAWILEAAPLVRAITESAYKHGSRLVTVVWSDQQITLARHKYAPKDSFDEYSTFQLAGVAESMKQGDAYLQVTGLNPDLLKEQDPEKVAMAAKNLSKNYSGISAQQGTNAVQWSYVGAPNPDWATKVFPDKSPEDAVNQLWEAVFKTVRVDQPDPAAFWEGQSLNLHKRREYLTAKGYTGLHYTAPGTDLKVGLPKGHIWAGGAAETPKGVSFIPNLPTEEVFTLPHKDLTEGTVTATKPLNYRGSTIDNFKLTFSKGKVVDFSAQKGQEALRGILETDDNAGRLGEVALIPHKTPISQSGIVFMSTLYDENASNHLALGKGYRFTLEGGNDMSDDEFMQAGGNISLVHVDFMFGSGEMNVDGMLADGTTEPVMRGGEWAFDV